MEVVTVYTGRVIPRYVYKHYETSSYIKNETIHQQLYLHVVSSAVEFCLNHIIAHTNNEGLLSELDAPAQRLAAGKIPLFIHPHLCQEAEADS